MLLLLPTLLVVLQLCLCSCTLVPLTLAVCFGRNTLLLLLKCTLSLH
jgi:hypothetical protein